MKKIIRIIVYALLCTALLIAVKIRLTPILMKNANYGMTALKTKQAENVFIGSSMFRQGLDMDRLCEGENSYLLSYNGNQPWEEFLVAEEILKSGVRVKRMYIDMYAYTMAADVKLSDTRVFQDMPLSFVWKLYRVLQQYGDQDIGDLFEMAVQSNNEVFFTWPISFPLINERYKNGGNLGKTEGSTKEVLESLTTEFPNDVPLNEIQCRYMKQLIALCREYQTEIVFIETPKYEKLYRENDYGEIMKEYLDFLSDSDCTVFLSEQTAEYLPQKGKGCIIYSFDNENPEFFMDLIHMSYEGRKNFSQILMKELEMEEAKRISRNPDTKRYKSFSEALEDLME